MANCLCHKTLIRARENVQIKFLVATSPIGEDLVYRMAPYSVWNQFPSQTLAVILCSESFVMRKWIVQNPW